PCPPGLPSAPFRAACALQGAYGPADIQTHMRFEELAYRDGGQAVTIPFHRTLTVLGGLDADLRRRFAHRAVATLGGPRAAAPDNDELAEARAVLAQVEDEYQQVAGRHRRVAELRIAVARLDDDIRLADDRAARRRFDDAARAVVRLEAELALLNGAEPAERRLAEAAVAAVRLAAEHRAAVAALDQAREAFGDRRRLD